MEFYKDSFKLYRNSRGLTHAEIAKRLNLTEQSVEHWEAGRSKPRPARVYELAKILGCSAVDISDLKPEKWLTDKPEIIIEDNDVDLTRILEIWPKLTRGNRARVAALAMDLIEKSGGESLGNDMAKHSKAN